MIMCRWARRFGRKKYSQVIRAHPQQSHDHVDFQFDTLFTLPLFLSLLPPMVGHPRYDNSDNDSQQRPDTTTNRHVTNMLGRWRRMDTRNTTGNRALETQICVLSPWYVFFLFFLCSTNYYITTTRRCEQIPE